jgi:hypothetical protein
VAPTTRELVVQGQFMIKHQVSQAGIMPDTVRANFPFPLQLMPEPWAAALLLLNH